MNNSSRNSIIIIAFWAVSAIACGTYTNIYSNYDKAVDFTKYQTFAWTADSIKVSKEFENSAYDNDIVRNNAKNYITHRLTQRGLLVSTESPDVLLQLVLLNEKKERIVSYNTQPYPGYYLYNPYYFPYYYPYYRYYTWYGWYAPYGPGQTNTYTKTWVRGTITVNMYDRGSKKLVWTGSAEGDIYDPSYLEFGVHPAIDKILKTLPIKQVNHKPAQGDSKMKNRVVRVQEREFQIQGARK